MPRRIPTTLPCRKVKSKDALLFGEKLEDISIGGRGTIDGQQKYFWAEDTLESTHWIHKLMQIENGRFDEPQLSCGASDAAGLSAPVVAG